MVCKGTVFVLSLQKIKKVEKTILAHEADCDNLLDAIDRLLSPLTPEQQLLLIDEAEVWRMGQGDIVFDDGDEPLYMYFVVEGKVRMQCDGIDGRPFVVRMIEPQGTFGYSALFAERKHYTHAIAARGTVLVCTPLSLIIKFMEDNSNFSMAIVRELSLLLSRTVTRTVSLTQKNIRGRLADCLLNLVDQFGLSPVDHSLPVYLSRNELAQMSAMAPNNAIRTLSQFASEGVVGIEGRKLSILDMEGLRRIARLG